MTDTSLIEKLRSLSFKTDCQGPLMDVVCLDDVVRLVREHEAEVYNRKIITPKPIPYEPMYAEESCKAREHKAQAGNPKAWYDITDMTGEVHRIPINIKNAAEECILREHGTQKEPHPFTDEKKSREAFEKWFTEKYEWQPFPENHPRFWRDMFTGWQGAISAYERAKKLW